MSHSENTSSLVYHYFLMLTYAFCNDEYTSLLLSACRNNFVSLQVQEVSNPIY